MVWHSFEIYPWMLDDAFITFRYAENLASGNGLVYNIGERVEGCTAFLWTLLLGGGKCLGLNTVVMAKVMAWIFGVATILLLFNSYRFIQQIGKVGAAVAALFVASCGIFTPWMCSGMEVNMFTFFILASLLFYLKGIYVNNKKYLFITGIFLAFTVMTRPDGALVVIILFCDNLFRSIKNRNYDILYLAVPSALLYLPYFIWRYLYFGYLLPNTYYAKVGYGIAQILRGFNYLGDFLIPVIILVILAGVGVFRTSGKKGNNIFYLFLSVIFLFITYTVLVGGDVMPAFRFFVPIIPFISLLAAIGVVSISSKRGVLIVMTAIVFAFNIYMLITNENITRQIFKDQVYLRGKYVGLWMKENLPANTLIATNTAGSIPYYSGLPTIDMLGMNDKHIAHKNVSGMGSGMAGHEKGDGAYVLSRQPDVIQFSSSMGSDKPGFPTDKELYDMPQFHEQYRLVPAYIPELERIVLFYIRKK